MTHELVNITAPEIVLLWQALRVLYATHSHDPVKQNEIVILLGKLRGTL
jgi:hypothetical protein